MKKAILLFICFSFMVLIGSSVCSAFEAVKFDNGVEFTFWGYVRNNTGVFTQNPNPWGPHHGESGNSLATERTWLKTYFDVVFNDQFRFYLVGQWAYEPWLRVQEGASVMHHGADKNSAYTNVNDVLREVYVAWSPNKQNTIKVGRMNVIWGETLTNRVGDVVNPNDITWALPWSMEAADDQRIPQYMIRGLHDIDCLKSSFEWIISPMLTSSDYGVSRVGNGAIFAAGEAGDRFAPAPETEANFMRSFGNKDLATIPGAGLYWYGYPSYAVDVSPMASTWNYANLASANPALGYGWGSSIATFGPGGVLVHNDIPDVRVQMPQGGWEDMRYGFRTNTMLSGYSFGAMYYHRPDFDNPVMNKGPITRTVLTPGEGLTVSNEYRNYTIYWPDEDNIGFYVNKQLPWPGVFRSEVVWTPNKHFNQFLPQVTWSTIPGFMSNGVDASALGDWAGAQGSSIVKRDLIKYMVAYDLSGFLFFPWHNTAPFDISFEHLGTWVPNARDLQNPAGFSYCTKMPGYQANFNARITTNWLYNKWATTVTGGYGTYGNSWLFVPAIQYNADWFGKARLTFELKWVYADSDKRNEGMGAFIDKNYVNLQTQFNF